MHTTWFHTQLNPFWSSKQYKFLYFCSRQLPFSLTKKGAQIEMSRQFWTLAMFFYTRVLFQILPFIIFVFQQSIENSLQNASAVEVRIFCKILFPDVVEILWRQISNNLAFLFSQFEIILKKLSSNTLKYSSWRGGRGPRGGGRLIMCNL